jgi:hypothetical protein
VIFDLKGNQTRARKTACAQCGAMAECDECWEHVSDWSPFGIWHSLLCCMPKVFCDGNERPMRCDFCGWNEATACRHHGYERDAGGKLVQIEITYNEDGDEIGRTRTGVTI